MTVGLVGAGSLAAASPAARPAHDPTVTLAPELDTGRIYVPLTGVSFQRWCTDQEQLVPLENVVGAPYLVCRNVAEA